jgi:hypothetical protein
MQRAYVDIGLAGLDTNGRPSVAEVAVDECPEVLVTPLSGVP